MYWFCTKWNSMIVLFISFLCPFYHLPAKGDQTRGLFFYFSFLILWFSFPFIFSFRKLNHQQCIRCFSISLLPLAIILFLSLVVCVKQEDVVNNCNNKVIIVSFSREYNNELLQRKQMTLSAEKRTLNKLSLVDTFP